MNFQINVCFVFCFAVFYTICLVRGMAGKFVDTISIFNRERNSVKMNISGFAKIFHEQIDEIL